MKKTNKFLLGTLMLGLVAISTFGALSIASKSAEEAANEDITTVVTETRGIKVRNLGSGIENGNPYRTFSYTTTPTIVKKVLISLSFADARDNKDDYITLDNYLVNHTLKVTCLQAFDSVATIHFQSGQASANVTVNYRQKFTGLSSTSGGNLSRSLSYDSSKYDPANNITTDTHGSLLDVLPNGATFFVVDKSSTYTVADNNNYSSFHVTGWNVPQGLGYTTYADLLKTGGGSVYTNFYAPAFANLSLAADGFGYNGGFGGIYKALNTQWANLTASQKQDVADSLDGNELLTIEFDNAANMNIDVDFYSAGVTSRVNLNRGITLKLDPMTSWGIGYNANTLFAESNNLEF